MLALEVKERSAKESVDALRARGAVPAVFYGPKEAATPISIDALNDLLARGQVERQFDGAQVVYLDSPAPGPTWVGRPQPRLYAVVDAGGEVLTVERRVRRRG